MPSPIHHRIFNVIKLDEERFTDPKKCEYFFSGRERCVGVAGAGSVYRLTTPWTCQKNAGGATMDAGGRIAR